MVESTKPTVTITGISGYLGSHVCLLYLQSGEYNVRGTVRSKTNEKKIEPLRKAFGDLFDQLELVEADLLDEESLIAAIAGSDYVVHTASPFVTETVKDENILIKPAVNGTLAVMKGCRAAKVKRVVITSSVAAIMNVGDESWPDDDIFTEADWSEPESKMGSQAYNKSKTLAEKAAWDY